MAGPITAPSRPRRGQAAVAPVAPEAIPASEPSKEPAPKRMGYKAKTNPIYHSYQNVLIPVAYAVPLIRDNWVEVQLQAGVIEEVPI